MKNKLSLLVIMIFAFCLPTIAQQTGLFSGSVSWSNSQGTQTRSTAVYVPSDYNASNYYTLIIGFYGQGDTPMNYIQNPKIMGFATDQYFGDVILVVPDDGAQESWFYGDEDFGIIKALKDQISSEYNIDPSQVYVQGFSFGGKSAFLHGLEEANEIAGVLAYSPAFYGDEDLYNNCIVSNCVAAHHDFNYANASQVKVCTSAGGGPGYVAGATPANPSEGYMTPLASGDQGGATWQDSFLGLAIVSADYINSFAPGNALFIGNENSTHSLPVLDISKQCWDFVYQTSSLAVEEQQFNADVVVYPNPSNDVIWLSNATGQNIQITNMAGQVVLEVQNYQGEPIDVSTIEAGNYILMALSDDNVSTQKIIIQ